MLNLLSLTDIEHRFLDQLSGGQQQRSFIAMIFAQDTDYILLDEPLNNLDMRHARSIMQTLRKAADEMAKTIILVIHDINFAASYSDHFIALKDGAIIANGSVNDIMSETNMLNIYDLKVPIQVVNGKKMVLYYS